MFDVLWTSVILSTVLPSTVDTFIFMYFSLEYTVPTMVPFPSTVLTLKFSSAPFCRMTKVLTFEALVGSWLGYEGFNVKVFTKQKQPILSGFNIVFLFIKINFYCG